MKIELNGHVLHPDDQRVLLAVAEEDDGGGVKSGALRELIASLETTSQSSYRLNKLEEAGLVETWYEDAEGRGLSPRVANITDAGRSVIDGNDLREYVEIEGVKNNEERIGELEAELESMSLTVETLENRVEKLMEFVDAIQTVVEREGINVSGELRRRKEEQQKHSDER